MHIVFWGVFAFMKKFSALIRPMIIIAILAFVILIISEPQVCTDGAARGILLCGRVIIPSLFPFTVCVLFIMKTGILSYASFLNPFSKRLFRLTGEQFAVMLLSFIGGYPIGAKLINEMYRQNKISLKNAELMVNYCVNAGPAFIVIAVGSAIYSSQRIGYILLFSHIAASFLIALSFRVFLRPDDLKTVSNSRKIGVSDNFVLSVSDAASAVFGICSYVILFSAVSAYLENFSDKIIILKYLRCLLEVTVGVSSVKNLITASFLLGFAGFCIWCQVLSVSIGIKINIFVFAAVRILHGAISAVITYFALKIAGVSVSVFSNASDFSAAPVYTTLTLSLSLVSMAVLLIISIASKKYSGNILKDLV